MRVYSFFEIYSVLLISSISASSIDKFCGNGNEIKEIIFSFDKYQGQITDDLIWNDPTMSSDKDTIIWLTFLDTEKKIASLGKTDATNNEILFDPIATSIGYVCKTDGAIAISIGNPEGHNVVIGFRELWSFDVDEEHTFKFRAKNNGQLTLSIFLYNECQTKCQRDVAMILSSNTVYGIKYREMDILNYNGGSNTEFDIGKSCELHAPIRVYQTDKLWNFEIINIDDISWKEGDHQIFDGVTLRLSDRNNICGLFGEDNATIMIILGIITIILIILFLIYLQIRNKIFDFNEWIKIQSELNKMELD